MTTRRQRERKIRKAKREQLIAIRTCKMEAARFAFNCAKFYHENNNIPGTMFWEREYRTLTEEAANV